LGCIRLIRARGASECVSGHPLAGASGSYRIDAGLVFAIQPLSALTPRHSPLPPMAPTVRRLAGPPASVASPAGRTDGRRTPARDGAAGPSGRGPLPPPLVGFGRAPSVEVDPEVHRATTIVANQPERIRERAAVLLGAGLPTPPSARLVGRGSPDPALSPSCWARVSRPRPQPDRRSPDPRGSDARSRRPSPRSVRGVSGHPKGRRRRGHRMRPRPVRDDLRSRVGRAFQPDSVRPDPGPIPIGVRIESLTDFGPPDPRSGIGDPPQSQRLSRPHS
jgi:hypothetical protein